MAAPQAYKTTVLADSPTLLWFFDENSAAVGQQYTNSGLATPFLTGNMIVGGGAVTASFLFSEYYLTGSTTSGSLVSLSNAARLLTAMSQFTGGFDISPTNPNFSVEWWMKPGSTSFNVQTFGSITFPGTGAKWGYFTQEFDTNGGMYVGIQLSDRFTPADADMGGFRRGAVYHMVFTYDGTYGTIYKNGFLLARRPMLPPTGPWSGSAGWFGIGNGTDAWRASYDNIAVYNSVLSQAQVTSHYLAGLSNNKWSRYASYVISQNPNLYYRLGDASGSITDYSQTGASPGTFVGGANGIMFQQPGLVDEGDDGFTNTATGGVSGTTPGNSPYINTAASLGIGGAAGQFTVEWWQRVSSFPTGSAINNTIGAGNGKFFAGCSGSAGEGFCNIGATDGFTPKDLGRGWYDLNKRAHYMFSYDGTTWGYMFKNGRFMFRKRMQPATAWGANGFAIGSGSWGGEYDDVAVYDQIIWTNEYMLRFLSGLGTSSLDGAGPTVTSVQTYSGSGYTGNEAFTTGGTRLIISGSNFTPNTYVYISGSGFSTKVQPNPHFAAGWAGYIYQPWTNLAAVGVSGSQILAFAPTGTLGSASIIVVNPDQQSATSSLLLNYVTASDAYHAQVVADKPVLYWRLDDDSGSYRLPNYVATDANDVLYWRLDEFGAPFSSSGNGSILPLFNRISGSVTGTTGRFDLGAVTGAAAFPGQNGGQNFFYLDTGPTGTTLHEISTNFSVGCWVYVLDYGYVGGGPGNYSSIVGKAYRKDSEGWSSPFWSWDIQFLNDGTGRLYGNIVTAGVNRSLETNFVVPLKQWVHVGMTYDGSTITIYGNGASVGTIPIVGTIDYGTHGPYRVGGGYFSGSDTFHGLIDDIRIANVTRNAAYFSQFSGSGGPSLVQDWSGNNNTGSVYQAFPNLLFQQPGLINTANKGMTNIPSDAPTPFVANTGDQTGQSAPPACGIGTGSFSNAVTSFSVEWWHRRDLGPLLSVASAIGTHRFGFAQGQFLYNVINSSGRVNVGTDAANVMDLINFVDPSPTFPPRQHHYCYTFADNGGGQTGTGIMYRDGIQISSNVNQRVPLGWQAFEAIGPFSGSFDEVAVYPYVLSQAQVYAHYALGQNGQASDPGNLVSGSLESSGTIGSHGAEEYARTSSGSIFFFLNTGSFEGVINPHGAEEYGRTASGSIFSEGAAGSFTTAFLPDFATNGLMLIQAIQGAGNVDPGQGVPPFPHPEMANVENLFQAGSGSVTSGGGGGGGATPAPVIQNFQPSVGSLILSGTVLSFDVVDSGGTAPVYCAILANFQGIAAQEIIYNSVSFNSMYSNSHNSVSSSLSGSVLHFTLLRDGGWPSTVTLTPVAFSSGSENT